MTQPTPAFEAPDLGGAYLAGIDAGRRKAAADIRARRRAGMSQLQLRHLELAARIAESGK